MPVPYLTVADPRAAITLYEAAFGAHATMVLDGPGDSVMHAELLIGDESLMLSGEFPGFSSAPSGRSPVNLMLYVGDVDAAHARAEAAGLRSTQAPADQFWGDRTAKLEDGHGYEWTLATEVEELAPEEVQRRAAAYASAMGDA